MKGEEDERDKYRLHRSKPPFLFNTFKESPGASLHALYGCNNSLTSSRSLPSHAIILPLVQAIEESSLLVCVVLLRSGQIFIVDSFMVILDGRFIVHVFCPLTPFTCLQFYC